MSLSQIRSLAENLEEQQSGRGRAFVPEEQKREQRLTAARSDWENLDEQTQQEILGMVENLNVSNLRAVLYGDGKDVPDDSARIFGTEDEVEQGIALTVRNHPKSRQTRILDEDNNSVHASDAAPDEVSEAEGESATAWCRESEDYRVQEFPMPMALVLEEELDVSGVWT